MKNSRRASAFSLIEISIVIIIIGILVAGVTQGSRLLNQAKLSAAKTLTQSSPVASIKNLSLWIESTSDSSFQSADLDDATAIDNWNDINPQAVTRANFTGTTTTRPTYRVNIINGLPAVLFDGTDDFVSTSNFSNLATSSTVFAVVRLPSALAAKPILSKRPSAAFGSSAPNIQLSTSATGWQYCDGATQATSGTVCNYSFSSSPAASGNYVVSLVYNTSSTAVASETSTGIALFQNGTAQTKVTTTTTPNTAVTTDLMLGKDGTSSAAFFDSYIGEIIIFDRALKREERQSIEAYLGKKWGITMTVAAY